MSLLCFVPQVLIQVRIRDLLQRLYFVDGDKVRVQIHELNAQFLEGTLSKQMALNARQSFVWVVVCLLDQPQFLTLSLIQSIIS